MEALVSILAMLCLMGLIVSLFMILSKTHRRRGMIAALCCFFGAAVAGSVGSSIADSNARSLGWASASIQKEAQKIGIYQPDEWNIFQQKLAAKRNEELRAMRKQLLSTSTDGPSPVRPQLTEVAVAPSESTAASLPSMPKDQAVLLQIIETARSAFRSATTEMQEGATKPWRAKALCQNLSSLSIDNWVGEVTNLTTNGDGKGVLSVSVGDDVALKTWNNAMSDVFDATLIEPGSPLCNKLLLLKEGERIRFSGSFLSSDTDCLRESSLTLRGSITDPEFVFRFSDVSKL